MIRKTDLIGRTFRTIDEDLPLVHVGLGREADFHAFKRILLELAIFLVTVSMLIFQIDDSTLATFTMRF